jgi:hypothetical protein
MRAQQHYAGVESSVAFNTWVHHAGWMMCYSFLRDFWFVKNPVNWNFPCVWSLATFESFPRHVVGSTILWSIWSNQVIINYSISMSIEVQTNHYLEQLYCAIF